jgi:hypothetical protein
MTVLDSGHGQAMTGYRIIHQQVVLIGSSFVWSEQL